MATRPVAVVAATSTGSDVTTPFIASEVWIYNDGTTTDAILVQFDTGSSAGGIPVKAGEKLGPFRMGGGVAAVTVKATSGTPAYRIIGTTPGWG